VAVVARPKLFGRMGVVGGLLIVAGGLVYSAGAVVYGLRRPDPAPAVFGYHEVFRLLVIAGVAATFWPSACTRCPPADSPAWRPSPCGG
jgi:hemolysin III